MTGFSATLRRELTLTLRQAGDSAVIVMFFVLVAILFPFGLGPDPNLLARIAPGIIWVAALLAAMLSLDWLFAADFEDGSLEQLALSPSPLSVTVAAKLAAHWLTTGLPLMIAAPLIGILYNLPTNVFPVLLLGMALGTPVLSLIGGIGAALTLGARRGGVLLSLLVLPLLVPVLIFGTAAADAALGGFSAKSPLLLLGGILLGSLAIAPIATAAAIRQALE